MANLKHLFSRISFLQWPLIRGFRDKLPWQSLLEIGFVVLWAVWVSRSYLNFSPLEWPHGREFGMAIQPHYIWTLLRQCGDCLLWNGMYNGGSPAFIELHAAVLHPLVIIATLIWGGFNGAKVVVIGSLAMAGIGQWWLARAINLGFVSRLWSAMVVVTGGHLAGKMEIGVVGVVLSTAACSLAIAPALKLAQNGRRRDAIILGFVLALAIVSGQGYMQLGFAMTILPALIIFWLDENLQLRAVWKEFALAGLLSVLLAGPLLIPLAHYWPEFAKDIDPEFKSAQPIEYVPLNFVINDIEFYLNGDLHKSPNPYLYYSFIGWFPILLGIVPLLKSKPSQRKELLFLIIALFFVIYSSSGLPFKWLAQFWPDFATSIRHPGLIQGLGVPLIVTMGAWGIDLILKHNWPLAKLVVSGKQSHKRLIAVVTWIFAIVILIRSLELTYKFSHGWLYTIYTKQDDVTERILDDVKTVEAQWIALPFGEHFWGPFASERELKLTSHVRPWFWKNRFPPSAYIKATRYSEEVTDESELVDQYVDISIFRFANNEYASIHTLNGNIPCSAEVHGGHIVVTCDGVEPGQLVVLENNWDGWTVKRDGKPASLMDDVWLMAESLPGLHTYEFRYKPWDVPAGVALMLLGLLIALWLNVRSPLIDTNPSLANPTELLVEGKAEND
jgi:hypothetical protein